jgi:hypothetical protein
MIRVEETYTYEVDAETQEEAEELFLQYMQGYDDWAVDRVTPLENMTEYYNNEGERL